MNQENPDAPNSPALDFRNQRLENVNFSDRNLAGADFSGAHLEGANFTNAILDGANFTGAVLSDGAYWPGYTATFAGASLRDAILDTAEVSLVDFTNADLTGASAIGTNWDVAILDGAILVDVRTDGGLLGNLVTEQELRPRLQAMRTELSALGELHGPSSDEVIELLEQLTELWRTSKLYERNEAAYDYYGELVESLTERFGADHPRTMRALAHLAVVGSEYAAETGEARDHAVEALQWSRSNPGQVDELALCRAILRTYDIEFEDLETHLVFGGEDELLAYLNGADRLLNLVGETLERLPEVSSERKEDFNECQQWLNNLREQSIASRPTSS